MSEDVKTNPVEGRKRGIPRGFLIILVILLIGALVIPAVITSGFGLLKGQTVMTIDERSFSAEDYYWQLYLLKKTQLKTGDFLTQSQLQEKIGTSGVTLETFLRDSIESALKLSAAVNKLARDNGVTLIDTDVEAVNRKIEDFIAELGGRTDYVTFLSSNRTSEKALRRYFEDDALLTRIEAELYATDKKFDLSNEEKHIISSACGRPIWYCLRTMTPI